VAQVSFVDTTMRDAHQSLLATRITTPELVSIASLVDTVGYHAVEMWGGATYDAAVRYLDEDPWERLDKLRDKFTNTRIQMLLRGQNLLGYRNYADDVVELFVKILARHGMDIVRMFDALNDFRNLEKAADCVREEKMHLQIALSYTVSPVHNVDYFVNLADTAMELEADSICIKDMAGLLTPGAARELVKAIKENHDVPLEIHSHFSTGLADISYVAAAEAGADILDTATSALALGTSQPAVEAIWTALSDLGLASPPDYSLLRHINRHFTKVRENHRGNDSVMQTIMPEILENQIPGGMFSNLLSQLKSQRVSHLLPQVLEEVPRVREDLGYPPLVTPTSQIVGVQAVLNTISGERYKLVTKEVERYVKGYYGRPPAEVSQYLRDRILGDETSLECRAADLIPAEVESSREQIGLLAKTDEDLLTYLLLGEVGKSFLLRKYRSSLGVDFSLAEKHSEGLAVYPI